MRLCAYARAYAREKIDFVTGGVMREKDLEKKLKSRIEKKGGLVFKFVSPGNAGVPDRIVILPGGEVWFVELKTDTGRLSDLQVWQLARLKAAGCNVIVIRGKADLDAWEGGDAG